MQFVKVVDGHSLMNYRPIRYCFRSWIDYHIVHTMPCFTHYYFRKPKKRNALFLKGRKIDARKKKGIESNSNLLISLLDIAIETAALLNSLGRQVTVKYRNSLLTSFDGDISSHYLKFFKSKGVRFISKSNLTSLSKFRDGIRAVWEHSEVCKLRVSV
jgi:hypothetical protein